MTAPNKPWETCINQRTGAMNSQNLRSSNAGLSLPSTLQPHFQQSRVVPASNIPAPPLPARLDSSANVNRYYIPGNYSMYPSYNSYSNFGNYSPYNSFNRFGSYSTYSMNRFGYMNGNDPENRFIQAAEESTRPAFQSIESLVQAIGSISFMLDSTYSAIYNSFRAVLSVAENFGKLRSLFGQFFSVFAMFRTIRWIYRKCLYILGLITEDPSKETIWQNIVQGGLSGVEQDKPRTSWPIVMFMAVLFSGPYLVWKLLSSLNLTATSNPYDPRQWKKSKDPLLSAVALYDFSARSNQELNLQTGTRVFVAPQEFQSHSNKGWLIATDGRTVGLIPANYIQVLSRVHAISQPAGQIDRTNLPSKNSEESHSTLPALNIENSNTNCDSQSILQHETERLIHSAQNMTSDMKEVITINEKESSA